jgi:hypothetical protein
MPVAHAMEQSTSLHDWSLTVPIIGIILIFDQQYDRPPSALSFDRLIGRSHSAGPQTPLTWVQDQHVPYIIAALGYDDTTTPVEQFRSRYHLTADVPVLAGPALADTRHRSMSSDSGMFSSLFTPQKIALDRDYARAVLDALFHQVDR